MDSAAGTGLDTVTNTLSSSFSLIKGVFPVVALPRGCLLQSLSRNQSQGHHFPPFHHVQCTIGQVLEKTGNRWSHFSEVQLLLFLEILKICNRTSFRRNTTIFFIKNRDSMSFCLAERFIFRWRTHSQCILVMLVAFFILGSSLVTDIGIIINRLFTDCIQN